MNPIRTNPARLAALAALLAASPGIAPAHAALTYVTGFSKTANLNNNLNQNYPGTGFTAGGSNTGNPNASYIYNPYAYSPATTQAGNDGISYNITSDAAGHDYAEFGSYGTNGTTLTTTINLAGVTDFAALVSAYNGIPINVTFNGAGGTTQSFLNIAIPDFNGGASNVDDCTTPSLCRQTVYTVTSTGGGGSGNSTNGAYNTYNLLQLKFDLSPALEATTLESVTFSTPSYEGLLFGLTAITADPAPPTGVPEPATLALLAAGLLGAAAARRRA